MTEVFSSYTPLTATSWHLSRKGRGNTFLFHFLRKEQREKEITLCPFSPCGRRRGMRGVKTVDCHARPKGLRSQWDKMKRLLSSFAIDPEINSG